MSSGPGSSSAPTGAFGSRPRQHACDGESREELQAQREETEDGHESDYSDDSADDAAFNVNDDENAASDVDEDETDAHVQSESPDSVEE